MRDVSWYEYVMGDLPRRIDRWRGRILGKPTNLSVCRFPIGGLPDILLNNHGNPFEPCTYPLQTHEAETWLLELVAGYLGLESSDVDGFVAPCTTIATQYVALTARELWGSDMTAFYSANAHHCAGNTFRMLRVRAAKVAARENGEIDIGDLVTRLKEVGTHPAFIYATVGTTRKGAIDDIEAISRIIRDCGWDRCWLHVDAAIHGLMLPFLDDAPVWDFRLPEVDSIAISAHKFLGYHRPAGILMMRRRKFAHSRTERVEYAGTSDLRSIGSRDGFAPIEILGLLNDVGEHGLRRWAGQCSDVAAHAVCLLERFNLNPHRNRFSNVVTLDRPQDRVVRKYDLMPIDDDRAQIFVMPHVDRGLIDTFMRDVVGFPYDGEACNRSAKPDSAAGHAVDRR